ncbi:hypothetical protein DUI87_34074 [Hirundo rustica rustica]|uniref:Uncharacterized protein n=1 Tax=Hirundo rustica rustica TaxID=333673 RepID=A0A3M0IJE3_HIRRU|nr:hypothetical protein DUI87_34074 [Hirundo rustica rustica]
MDVAAAVDVTMMTTNPLKIPTGLIGPIIINGQPDLSGFQLDGRSQHQNLKVEGIRNPQLHLDGLVRLHQKFLLTVIEPTLCYIYNRPFCIFDSLLSKLLIKD